MKLGKLATVAACLAVAAYGQGGPPRGGGFGGPRGGFAVPGPGPGMAMHDGKIVTGLPYSATATSVYNQTLQGGNTIQRTTTAQIARDSQGRTYTLQTMNGGPLGDSSAARTMIFISDPVAAVGYVLDATNKIATKRTMRANDGVPWPDRSGHRGMSGDPNGEATITQGTYSGLAVEIKSLTHTIPAGVVGNAQPIVSTSAIYYSTDLQTVVYATHADPRGGQNTFSLTDIKAGEPSAALFQVPSDYTIKDAPAHFGWGGGGGAHAPAPPQ